MHHYKDHSTPKVPTGNRLSLALLMVSKLCKIISSMLKLINYSNRLAFEKATII